MKLKENKKIQKDIDDLADIVKGLKRIVVDGETDDIDFVKDWQDTCYFIRQATHDITKKVNKHVSETLNPEYYEAKSKKGAKKTRGDRATEAFKQTLRNDEDKKNAYIEELSNDISTIINLNKMNEIMPGKEPHHPSKITISKKDKPSTIKLGNSPLHNPIHENDKPFE